MSDLNAEDVAARLVALGYDLDDLERDNPYNQWVWADDGGEQVDGDVCG